MIFFYFFSDLFWVDVGDGERERERDLLGRRGREKEITSRVASSLSLACPH